MTGIINTGHFFMPTLIIMYLLCEGEGNEIDPEYWNPSFYHIDRMGDISLYIAKVNTMVSKLCKHP